MFSARFERATYRLGGDRSIQLSYENVGTMISIESFFENRYMYVMRIGVIGVNHHSPIEEREKISLVAERKLKGHGVLLSTCNRCELYFSSDELALMHIKLLNLIREEVSGPFEEYLYSYFERDAFLHLSRVTAGLDSALVGESEIQGQVKRAYMRDKDELSSDLHFAFQKSLKIGKDVRTLFEMPKGVSRLAEVIGKLVPSGRVLLIGNSVINRSLMRSFERSHQITLCSRTGVGSSWDERANWSDYDAVISASHHRGYLLPPPKEACKTVLIDLSVPRNIDPDLGKINPLYNIDRLMQLTDKNVGVQPMERYVLMGVERQIVIFHNKMRVGVR
ncbi:MAG: Glutamyl-tRNA reductase [Chlamydiia bacterium]|nr:Glutamyl-tRNA reductase [Chlamydiia bacterium]MCH9615041.1 Glutamyl-tRNA reductase [Chlamydiia bacterium]MCH9629908.1 Glutamyl-tRNA reductase [Chlamydiia bacterium]